MRQEWYWTTTGISFTNPRFGISTTPGSGFPQPLIRNFHNPWFGISTTPGSGFPQHLEKSFTKPLLRSISGAARSNNTTVSNSNNANACANNENQTKVANAASRQIASVLPKTAMRKLSRDPRLVDWRPTDIFHDADGKRVNLGNGFQKFEKKSILDRGELGLRWRIVSGCRYRVLQERGKPKKQREAVVAAVAEIAAATETANGSGATRGARTRDAAPASEVAAGPAAARATVPGKANPSSAYGSEAFGS